jgi:thiol-disulfide isomerase/thioredoxin
MSNKKYLGLPLWVWLIVIGMIAYNCYITTSIVINDNMTVKKEKFANNDDMIKIHNFNTEWCGYSKQFQPTWYKFAQNKNMPKNVIAIDAKCDNKNSMHAKLAHDYNVRGFPTVVAEKNGKISHYEGPRTEEALLKWANQGCGL